MFNLAEYLIFVGILILATELLIFGINALINRKHLTDTEEIVKLKNRTIVKSLISFLLTCFFIFTCLNALDYYTQNPGDNPTNTDGIYTLFSRSATNNDITIKMKEELSLSIPLKITPKKDIKNLQITINFLDEDEDKVKTITKIIGNVSKDIKYDISIELTEFELNDVYDIKYWNCDVTGGTVTYFQ